MTYTVEDVLRLALSAKALDRWLVILEAKYGSSVIPKANGLPNNWAVLTYGSTKAFIVAVIEDKELRKFIPNVESQNATNKDAATISRDRLIIETWLEAIKEMPDIERALMGWDKI